MSNGFHLDEVLISKVDAFGALVSEWNKFSLVANSTLKDLWGWHFKEAFSIVPLLEQNKCLQMYDFGSGGGVIGFPLCLYGFDITLIERSSNKLFFLKKILKYENVLESMQDYSEALVIVRGVCSIYKLLKQLKHVKILILFKSSYVQDEIDEALRYWDFKYELFDRVGRASGYIVYIYEIYQRNK